MKRALWFCAGLLVAMPVCLLVWGYALPAYAQVLAAVAKVVLVALGHPIESVEVTTDGVLNTQTQLAFTVGLRRPTMDVGALVFNVPPFVALMSITPGLGRRQRLRALAIGLAVLVAGHVLYVVLAFHFAARIADSPEIPLALGEFFLTFPFLLWIVLGYWERVAENFTNPRLAPRVPQAPPESNGP